MPQGDFNYKHCVTASPQPICTREMQDAHQRLNEKKNAQHKREKKPPRTYDTQTRKKINKHAVAAITVLPSAWFCRSIS